VSYPPEWKAVSLATKIEAGFRCVRCGHPNGRWSRPGNDHALYAESLRWRVLGFEHVRPRVYEVEGGGAWLRHHAFPCDRHCTHDPEVRKHRVLTVHHLDGVKANLAWFNLAALCQRCHLEIQGRVRMEQSYLHPHSEWFRPYVAGYYAHTVLGEVLTRAEVEARLPELLCLGQPHLTDHYPEAP
jgi:hypothetical protein